MARRQLASAREQLEPSRRSSALAPRNGCARIASIAGVYVVGHHGARRPVRRASARRCSPAAPERSSATGRRLALWRLSVPRRAEVHVDRRSAGTTAGTRARASGVHRVAELDDRDTPQQQRPPRSPRRPARSSTSPATRTGDRCSSGASPRRGALKLRHAQVSSKRALERAGASRRAPDGCEPCSARATGRRSPGREAERLMRRLHPRRRGCRSPGPTSRSRGYEADFLWPDAAADRRGRRLPVPRPPPRVRARPAQGHRPCADAGYRVIRITVAPAHRSEPLAVARTSIARGARVTLGRRAATSIRRRCVFCSPTTTASRPRACRRCAGRCSRLPGIELAVIAPDGNRSAMARSITTRRPLWVQEVDFGDGTVGYATDGTPVDCVRLAQPRADRGLRGRAGRLRDQPRLQPRRRHHLLGHGRGGARGDRPRAAGDRGLPAVERAASSTSAPGEAFDFEAAAAFTARLVAELEDVPLPDGHAAEHQRPRRPTRAGSRWRGSASASTATSSRWSTRTPERPPAVPDLRRRQLRARRDRAPTSRRWPRARSRSRRSTST